MPIVVIEGADGTGKTTLAEHLVRYETRRPCQILHATYADDQFAHDLQLLVHAVRLHLDGYLVILDRHWIGADVYNRVYRGHAKGTPWVRRMDSVLRRYGALYVLATPAPEQVEQEFNKLVTERQEMYSDKMGAVAEIFYNLAYGAQVPLVTLPDESYVEQAARLGWWTARGDVVIYNRYRTTPKDGAADVLTRLKVHTQYVEQHAEAWSSVGDNLTGLPGHSLTGFPNQPTTLLVGDQINPNDPRVSKEFAWPFVSDAGSSLYLAAAIHKAELDEATLAYVNAHRADGEVEPALPALCLLNRRVIALGTRAADTLRSVGVTGFVQIPHPQWARRFDHHGGSYHLILRGAVQ